jgi:dienelactone hydrolase
MKLNRRELLALAAASPALAQLQVAGPDLENLYPLMDWIGGENRPKLSYLETRWKSFEEWKRAARPVYRAHLSYDPKPLPLAAESLGREEREGFTIERVRIKATSNYDIPGWVLVPAKRTGKLPGIVAHHCHSGRYVWGHEKVLSWPDENPELTKFRTARDGRAYAEVLVRRGYVVLIIDAFYFGERRLKVEDIEPSAAPGEMRESLTALKKLERNSAPWLDTVNSLCSRYEQVTAKTIFSAGATWPGMLAWDDSRAVDYLVSRPEVDPKRIGALGLSIGGLRTARLVALDPRVKVSCVTGWMTEFRAQLRNHLRTHTWMAYIPGLQRSLDLPDETALTMPGALLVQQCRRDSLYPIEGMVSVVEKLTKIYTKAGIPERFKGTFYDVPHSFKPDMQEEAFSWIARWI